MREPIGSAAYYTAVYNGASYVHARAYWLCCVLYGGTLSTCASLLPCYWLCCVLYGGLQRRELATGSTSYRREPIGSAAYYGKLR